MLTHWVMFRKTVGATLFEQCTLKQSILSPQKTLSNPRLMNERTRKQYPLTVHQQTDPLIDFNYIIPSIWLFISLANVMFNPSYQSTFHSLCLIQFTSMETIQMNRLAFLQIRNKYKYVYLNDYCL